MPSASLLSLLLAGCNPDAPDPVNVSLDNGAKAAEAAPSAPLPEPPIDRPRLLAAAVRAASGNPQAAEDRALAGRRFILRIAFGCAGSAEVENPAIIWSYDGEEQTLRLSADPGLPGLAPELLAQAGPVEAVEGFWIPRSWTDDESCAAPPPPSPSPSPPTAVPAVGVVQLFTAADSRVRQRAGRPYESVRRVEPESLPGAAGFRLVLRGRLSEAPSGQTIICGSPRREAQPTCLIAVELDEVSIEDGATSAVLATWGSG